jgi:hypothetical protein
LHCRKQVRPQQVHSQVLSSRRDSLELDGELLLPPDAELSEGFEKVADRAREGAVVFDEAAEEDSGAEEDGRSRVRNLEVRTVGDLREQTEERDLVVYAEGRR